MSVRRPEPGLEVLWQRHVPAGMGEPHSDERVDPIADLVLAVEEAVDELDVYGSLTDDADLVITISRRPQGDDVARANQRQSDFYRVHDPSIPAGPDPDDLTDEERAR